MSAKPTESLIAASRWYALLSSEEATQKDFAEWQRWKEQSNGNQLAWQRVEALGTRLSSLPANIQAEAFNPKRSVNRRQVLKQMAVLLGVGTCAAFMVERKPWQDLLADQVTATGDTRTMTLPDGSQIHLNTASAINIQYTSTQRVIQLIKGEILIHTAQETQQNNLQSSHAVYRPFSVITQHGIATALGTEFNVRLFDHHSKVTVYEGAVKINPADQHQASITLQAGESAVFDQVSYTQVQQETSSAWAKGLLVVYSMPLSEFAQELSRYRDGLVRCEPSVSQLLVSGSFHINDTDAVLARLADILPVKIQSRTRYWVTISPA